MKFIYNSLIFKFIFLLLFSPLFASHREGPKSVEAMRSELEKQTSETAAKEKEIEKQKQAIEKQKERGEIDEKTALDESVKLDKELQESIDAKIKATDDLLSFNPADREKLIEELKTSLERKKTIEAQIKKIETTLASEGTSTTGPSQSEVTPVELSLGKRISTNLEIWRKTALANVHERLGNYLYARDLRANLVTLHELLNQPLEKQKNKLAENTLNLKMGLIPDNIYKRINKIQIYLGKIIEINNNERDSLKLAKTDLDRQKIKKNAQQQRENILNQNDIANLAETILTLNDKLNSKDIRAKINNDKLDKIMKSVQRELNKTLEKLDLYKEGFGPRNEEQRKNDANRNVTRATELLSSEKLKKFDTLTKRLLEINGEFSKGLLKAQNSAEYKELTYI